MSTVDQIAVLEHASMLLYRHGLGAAAHATAQLIKELEDGLPTAEQPRPAGPLDGGQQPPPDSIGDEVLRIAAEGHQAVLEASRAILNLAHLGHQIREQARAMREREAEK